MRNASSLRRRTTPLSVCPAAEREIKFVGPVGSSMPAAESSRKRSIGFESPAPAEYASASSSSGGGAPRRLIQPRRLRPLHASPGRYREAAGYAIAMETSPRRGRICLPRRRRGDALPFARADARASIAGNAVDNLTHGLAGFVTAEI